MKKTIRQERMVRNGKPTVGDAVPNPVRELPCPVCKALNPVNRANLRIKCDQCGTKLLSVKVVKNIRRQSNGK